MMERKMLRLFVLATSLGGVLTLLLDLLHRINLLVRSPRDTAIFGKSTETSPKYNCSTAGLRRARRSTALTRASSSLGLNGFVT